MLTPYVFIIKHVLLAKKNIKDTIGAFLFSCIGAMMEGSSYGVLILTFAALTNNKIQLPDFIPFKSYIESCSSSQLLIFSLILAALCQAVRSLFIYLSSHLFAKLTGKGMKFLLKSVNQQVLKLSYSSIHRYKVGEITDLISSIPTFFPHWMNLLSNLISNFFLIIVAMSVLLFFSAKLILVILCIFATAGAAQRLLMKKLGAMSIVASEEGAKKTSDTAQLVSGIRQVQIFNFQKNIDERMNSTIDNLSSLYKKIGILNGTILSINELITIIAICSAIAVGYFTLYADQSANMLPLLLGFMPIALRLAMRIAAFANFLTQITWFRGKVDMLRQFIDPQGKEYIDETGHEIASFNQEISFENVSFTYPEKNEPAIAQCSFKLLKGSVTAFVGESGAGKSTLLDLILKLHYPSEGAIYVDGKDIKDISPQSWRSIIGVVSQDPCIFHESVEFNIKMGNPNASYDDLINASKLAGAHDFISQLEHGYQTIVGERGHRLSGGEKQRISLARALIRNPQILILDEATSNLDSESETIIQESLEKLRSLKTIIVVAHRLSTIANADSILVINEGKVAEKGAHADLLKNQGKYATFWNFQHKAMAQY